MYLQREKLLLADVFENFRNKHLEIYELEPVGFLTAPGLASQDVLEKTKVKLDLSIDIDMLFIVEKGISSGICHAIHQYVVLNGLSKHLSLIRFHKKH